MKPADKPAAPTAKPAATSAAPVSRPLGHAPSAKEAVEVFQRFWRAELMKPGGPPGAAQHDGLVTTGTPRVKRVAYRDHRALVVDRIGAREPNPAILFGTLASLDREGACWEIHYDGMLRGGLGACVDAGDGRVAFVWETPGG